MARNKFDIDEKLEAPFSLKHFKRAGKYVKAYAFKMLFSLFINIMSIIVSLFSPKIVRYAIDVSVPNKDIKQLLLLALLLMAAIVVSVQLVTWRSRIMARVGQAIVYDIRKDLFDHLQYLPFTYYDSRPHGKILVRVVQYVNSVSKMLSNGILNFILDIFNIVFITIFMFSENVTLSFVILAGMPLLMAGLWSVKAMQRRAWQSESNKNSNLNAYLNESINGMKITQLFVREKVNHEIFSNQAKAVSFAWQKAVALNQLVPFFAENISQWVMSFVYIAGMLWMYPTVTIGTLIAMGDYARRFWQPINRLAQIYNEFINTIAYLERIFETIDEPVTIADAADAYPLPPINGDVEFKNVSFAYEEGVNVLENLSFKVKAGESVALVGPTGAGKTTIVNLISRFYDVTAGEVLIDGNNISKVTLNSLRSQMGIMLQDSFIFSGTIADNIRFGKLDATQEEIEKACKTVFAHDFILQTEKGYETEVNERGSRLSQGQKQLLSFARTLISNPKILVLDEATAAIDAKTEKYVQKGINELLKGRTSFIIAHRLSTIKNCDKIMYISDKNIAECGTHDELIAKKGEYYRLYTSQLSEM